METDDSDMNTLRILVVDDHPITRRGTRQLLQEAYTAADIVEVHSGEAAVAAVQSAPFNLVVLDLSMPGMNGIEALERIARHQPTCKVLVLSMHAEDQFALRALRSGASGYLTKERAVDDLLEAVQRILAGGRWISSTMSDVLADHALGNRAGPAHTQLSARELRVLCMLAAGHTVTEIAAALSLSVKTVSTYRTRILEKMNLSTNAELTRYCIQHNLIG